MHHSQVRLCRISAGSQRCGPPPSGLGPCEENELAMERTVSGGTSPTAVTFLPPITVE
jgi:hypothetical protein